MIQIDEPNYFVDYASLNKLSFGHGGGGKNVPFDCGCFEILQKGNKTGTYNKRTTNSKSQFPSVIAWALERKKVTAIIIKQQSGFPIRKFRFFNFFVVCLVIRFFSKIFLANF